MVSALWRHFVEYGGSGVRRIRDAYAHAIAGGYRFYSYGDAMLLTRCADALAH